jgi:hypothetical protein
MAYLVNKYLTNEDGPVEITVLGELSGTADEMVEIILNGTKMSVYASMVFDHKPEMVMVTDEYGEFTQWQ